MRITSSSFITVFLICNTTCSWKLFQYIIVWSIVRYFEANYVENQLYQLDYLLNSFFKRLSKFVFGCDKVSNPYTQFRCQRLWSRLFHRRWNFISSVKNWYSPETGNGLFMRVCSIWIENCMLSWKLCDRHGWVFMMCPSAVHNPPPHRLHRNHRVATRAVHFTLLSWIMFIFHDLIQPVFAICISNFEFVCYFTKVMKTKLCHLSWFDVKA